MLKMTFVEKTLGIFLVTFSTPEDAHKVLEKIFGHQYSVSPSITLYGEGETEY
jgi:hypothetical protein